MNVSLGFLALGLHLSDVCEKGSQESSGTTKCNNVRQYRQFSSTHSGSKTSMVVIPEHLCSEPIRGPPGLVMPHEAL